MRHTFRWILQRLLPWTAVVILAGVFLFRIAFWRPEVSQKPAWTRGELGAIKTALGRFESRMGRLPTTGEGLRVLAGQGAGDLWSERYLEAPPRDAWGQEFHYACAAPDAGRGAEYEITSAGADGRWGTRDDIRARGRGAGQGLTISEGGLGVDWLMGLTIIAAGLLAIRGLRAEAPRRRARTADC